jgi:hypothetical protein
MSFIIFYPFAMHLKCDYASAGYTSDAFDLGIFMSIASFRDVIDPILSFCNALEVWLLIWW